MQSLTSLTNNGAEVPGLLYLIGAGGPHSINDSGQFLLLGVVGFTTGEFPEPIYIPLRWDPGHGLVSFDPQGASPLTTIAGLNARGQVIGRSGDHLFGFLYDDATGLSELNDRLAPGSGWQEIFPGDINDPGQILSDGATRIAGG